MKISEYFESEYLTAGRTYDNFVFENCPKEFLTVAKEKLSAKQNGVKPCNVIITRELEEKFEKAIENEINSLRRKIIARDFICALIAKEALTFERGYEFLLQEALNDINAIVNDNYEEYKKARLYSIIPSHIKEFQINNGKLELNFFLEGTKNLELQRAINIFVASREPFSVKIFTDNQRLPSYYEQNENFIESPHDYMRIDVNKFIEIDEEKEQ